jgi:hypothetical protein
MAKVGLNPAQVASFHGAVDSQLSILDAAQNNVASAGFAAANPLSLVLSPGSKIIAPMSIPQIILASAEISAARGSANDLLRRLSNEVGAQQFASSAEGFSYATGIGWRTQDGDRTPSPRPSDRTDDFNPLDFLRELADNVVEVYGRFDDVYDVLKKTIPDEVAKFTDWWGTLPKWVKKFSSSIKTVPILGTALQVGDTIDAWVNGNAQDRWRATGGLVIDLVGFVPNPWTVGISLVVGVGWEVGWEKYDNWVVFEDTPEKVIRYYEEQPWVLVVNLWQPLSTTWWGPFAD